MGNNGSTACASRACRPCNASDPTTDTVKIDQSVLGTVDKENAAPNILHCKAAEETYDQKENRHIEKERLAHQERQRQELEQRRTQEQQWQRAEAERVEKAKEVEQDELLERWRQQAAAAQREEAARRQQEAHEEDVRRQEVVRRQEAERIAQEQMAKQASDKKAVEEFLAANHFTDVNFKRRKMLKSCYPLHEAVSQENIVMAQLLVAPKANLELKSSAGETPLQLAQRSNRANSHAAVLKVLSAAPAPAKSKK